MIYVYIALISAGVCAVSFLVVLAIFAWAVPRYGMAAMQAVFTSAARNANSSTSPTAATSFPPPPPPQ